MPIKDGTSDSLDSLYRFRDYCTEKRPSKQDSRDLFSQKQFSIKFLAASLVSDDPRPEVLTWILDKDFTISDPNADCATIPHPTNLIRGETIKTVSKRQTLCPFWMGINIMIEGSRRSVLNRFVLNWHSTLQTRHSSGFWWDISDSALRVRLDSLDSVTSFGIKHLSIFRTLKRSLGN